MDRGDAPWSKAFRIIMNRSGEKHGQGWSRGAPPSPARLYCPVSCAPREGSQSGDDGVTQRSACL